MDPAAAQPGQLAEAQAGAEQGEHVIPPEQREAGRAAGRPPRGCRRGAWPPQGPARDRPGAWAAAPCAPGWRRWRLRPRRTGGCGAGSSGRPSGSRGRRAGELACQRRTSAGLICSMGRSPNQGRTWRRSRLSVAASVVGLRMGSAAHTSHHSSAQWLNGSRPRRRPRQVPRRISSRFSAARSRASSGVSTVLPPWEPSSSAPGDQVAVAALAPAHRPHQGLPAPAWRTAFGGPGRRGA